VTSAPWAAATPSPNRSLETARGYRVTGGARARRPHQKNNANLSGQGVGRGTLPAAGWRVKRNPDSLPAGLIGRTYFRREDTPDILGSNPLQDSSPAWSELGGLPEPTAYRASPRLYPAAPDEGDPALAGRREPCFHSGAGGGSRTLMGPSGGQFEPGLYRSARGHGRYRMGQAVARSSVVERKWVKGSQHFPAELRDFRVAVGANSHQMHYSVASAERPSPELRPPGSCLPW
jgi:hypothetical protein